MLYGSIYKTELDYSYKKYEPNLPSTICPLTKNYMNNVDNLVALGELKKKLEVTKRILEFFV